MNLTELNNTVMGLWPKCDWTPDEWALLAETVKRVDHDQAATMLREVRRTQRPGRNPDMQDITKRVRAMTNAPAAGPSRQGGSKWDTQRAVWGRHNLSDRVVFRLYWEAMRKRHQGPQDSFTRMWHGICASDARELGMCHEEAEYEASRLTGGEERPEPCFGGDYDDIMEEVANAANAKGQPRVNVAKRRRELRRLAITDQLNTLTGKDRRAE